MPRFSAEQCLISAVDLAHRIRDGEIQIVDVIDVLSTRIGKFNPAMHAYVTLDLENALLEAIDKQKMRDELRGENLPALFGVPVAVKDDIPVKGLLNGNGSRLCNWIADYDDITVERLRQAGAIILGKTHLPEFAHKGTSDNQLGPNGQRLTTLNPWDNSKTPGGSSSGSAVAVAMGMAFLALGTDIGGSIRKPASCCGIVGLKPTFGIVPRVPAGNAFSLWSTGTLARNCADTALMMSVLSGPDERDRYSLPRGDAQQWDLSLPLPEGQKILWCPNITGGPVDPVVAAISKKAVVRLAEHGFEIIETEPMITADEAATVVESMLLLFRAGSLAEFKEVTGIQESISFNRKADQLSPTYREFLKPAWGYTLDDYLKAQTDVTTFVEKKVGPYFQDFDFIATPSLAVLPFDAKLELGPDNIGGTPIDKRHGWAFHWPFNLSGHPAISIPCGWSTDTKPLPIGLQLVGKRGLDGLLLRVAASIERELGLKCRLPPI